MALPVFRRFLGEETRQSCGKIGVKRLGMFGERGTFQTTRIVPEPDSSISRQAGGTLSARAGSPDKQLQSQRESLQKQSISQQQLIQDINARSQKTIGEVTEKLTKLDETNKRVVDFATQLQSLENILKNPKRRGVLGEFFLEDLLGAVMPQGTYKMQYAFADGEIVDAALLIKDKIIPIDAKFSLEKYN